jgi:hypothetical protein
MGLSLALHTPSQAAAAPADNFSVELFLCCLLFMFSLDSLLCAHINLVFGSHPECVTDSLFK